MISRLKNWLLNREMEAIDSHIETVRRSYKYKSVIKKFIKTKNGRNVCLAHFTEELDFGIIRIIDGKGEIGKLFYTKKQDDSGQEYFYVSDLKYDVFKKWKFLNNINIGIGTATLAFLEEIAKDSGIKYITGWLSPVDLNDHKKRLLHFYKKNSYEIRENNESNEGGFMAKKIVS